MQESVLKLSDFKNPHGSKQGLLNADQSVGGVCSLPIAPVLADKIGRQKSVLIGSLIVALGAGLQSGARDVGMFIAGRSFSEVSRISIYAKLA
jgi:MFS family permease